MTRAFPKPSEVRKNCPAVKVFLDGREICQLKSKAGQDEYSRRKRIMWERQGKKCSLMITSDCKRKQGKLAFGECTFEHDNGRGHGGGKRDDRIEIGGKPINSVACWFCNNKKGSQPLSAFLNEHVIP